MPNALSLRDNDYLYLCDYNQLINTCIKDIFLANADNRKIETQDVTIDEKMLKERVKRLTQLIFEVSENCNLRCKYCVYNDNYINQRKLTPHDMSADVAEKGIDYIYSIIKDRKDKAFSMSFYGGEPMLNFNTVKTIIEYGKKVFSGWELFFNMTTNLTLLDDRKLDFLIEHDISVMVSLDGGKENHDAKRVYANGSGTFDKIMENLERIRNRSEDYYQRKISFSAVFSFDLSLEKQSCFFIGDDRVKNLRTRFGTVETYGTTYYDVYPFKQDEFRKDITKIFARILEKKRKEEKLTEYENFLFNNFKKIGDSLNVRKHTALGGTCLFDCRLFLDAAGSFHVCEKMNNTFPFGDIETGLDFAQMVKIANDFINAIKTSCATCDFRFLCSMCYASMGGNGEFRVNPEFCKTQKQIITNNLEGYIKYKEGKADKFHQFIHVEKGPVNSAIIDMLKGNVYQVENGIIDKLEKGEYEEIEEFLKSAAEEEILIDVNPKHWIPRDEFEPESPLLFEDERDRINLELHVEEGVELDSILEKLNGWNISKIVYYGSEIPGTRIHREKIVKKEKNPQACLNLANVDENFSRIDRSYYSFNMNYNSCWGAKIAFTSDGKIRPCIYSDVVVMNFNPEAFDIDADVLLEKMKEYWKITKDKVKVCKDCELRHICFDCRELARKQAGDLYAANPYCKYDPYKGVWRK